jgi:SMI1 / KNR4 family (SUKH-1)
MTGTTLPPLEWPSLLDAEARSAWYRAVIAAYASLWEGHVTQPKIAPVSEAAMAALETRLGCRLPPPLRAYHLEFGALNLAERLCALEDRYTQIEPLLEAYPGIPDMEPSPEELSLAGELIAFGDYLGNGNMFCFHRETGAVYYFDHDSPPMLTRFFGDTQTYLDALMVLTLAEAYDAPERGEELLAERFGAGIARKWRY